MRRLAWGITRSVPCENAVAAPSARQTAAMPAVTQPAASRRIARDRGLALALLPFSGLARRIGRYFMATWGFMWTELIVRRALSASLRRANPLSGHRSIRNGH